MRDTPSRSLASAGDVDGDGFDDLVVGGGEIVSAFFSEPARVKVYRGSATGPGSLPAWTPTAP